MSEKNIQSIKNRQSMENGQNSESIQSAQPSAEQDWELSADYYQAAADAGSFCLEDFIEAAGENGADGPGLDAGKAVSGELEHMAQLVTQVQALSGQGRSAEAAAEELGVEAGLVRDILICTQAFPEDDPLAVARLIVLG